MSAPDKAPPGGCKTDADCDDGDGCNGEERCDVASGGCLPALAWTCPVAPPRVQAERRRSRPQRWPDQGAAQRRRLPALTSAPPALVTGEYSSGNVKGRLVRWPLDPTSGKLKTKGGAVTSAAAYFPGVAAMQGGVAAGARIYVTSNANTGGYASSLHTGLIGGAVSALGFPHGIEDLHYSPGSTNIWSNTEFPGQRFVFSVKTSKALTGCK